MLVHFSVSGRLVSLRVTPPPSAKHLCIKIPHTSFHIIFIKDYSVTSLTFNLSQFVTKDTFFFQTTHLFKLYTILTLSYRSHIQLSLIAAELQFTQASDASRAAAVRTAAFTDIMDILTTLGNIF